MKYWISSVAVVLFFACSDSGHKEPLLPSLFREGPTVIDHNKDFTFYYLSTAANKRNIELEIDRLPSWMIHDEVGHSITGVPGWSRLDRNFTVEMTAYEGGVMVESYSFSFRVGLGEIVCDSEFNDPSTSLYKLPYDIGKSVKLWAGYCLSNPAGGHYMWFAYDFQTSMGDNVLASRAGEVIATKEINTDEGGDCSGGKENYVFILHEDGTAMNYVHFQHNSVFVEVGQQVAQGEVIGLTGNSGCSAGPHIHTSLFRARGNYDRQYTLPLNYSNADGEHNDKNGLITGEYYKAL